MIKGWRLNPLWVQLEHMKAMARAYRARQEAQQAETRPCVLVFTQPTAPEADDGEMRH